MALGRAVRRMADPGLRSIEAARRNPATFQPFPTTAEDRYPALFDALAERLAPLESACVLSFGCSDGAEVRSLRRWLPGAEIVGIDVNARSIALARRHLDQCPDPRIRFEHAGDTSDFPDGAFDAILAMAVFRHGVLEAERPDSCAQVLPFARFAQGLAGLDRCLRPGGWMAVWNAHFRFADTPLAPGYEAQALPWSRSAPMELLYGPDDRRIVGEPYAQVLFRKRA